MYTQGAKIAQMMYAEEARMAGEAQGTMNSIMIFGYARWWWYVFFFSSRRRHTRFDCDWSSDVCSSDLLLRAVRFLQAALPAGRARRRGTPAQPDWRWCWERRSACRVRGLRNRRRTAAQSDRKSVV